LKEATISRPPEALRRTTPVASCIDASMALICCSFVAASTE
jgi:hypothetical protein